MPRFRLSFRLKVTLLLALLLGCSVLLLGGYFIRYQREEHQTSSFQAEYFQINTNAAHLESILSSGLLGGTLSPETIFQVANPCETKQGEVAFAESFQFAFKAAGTSPKDWLDSARFKALCQRRREYPSPVFWQPGLDPTRDGPASPLPALLLYSPNSGKSDHLSLLSLEVVLASQEGKTAFLTDAEGGIIWSDASLGTLRAFFEKVDLTPAQIKVLSGRALQSRLSSVFTLGDGSLVSFAPVRDSHVLFSVVPEAFLKRGTRTLLEQSVWLILGFLFLSIFLGSMFAGRIAQPLRLLAAGAEHFGNGDLKTRVAVTANDEVGTIQSTFNLMADRIVNLIRRTRKQAQLESDIKVAQEVQSLLLPGADVLVGAFRLTSSVKMADQCGGDWWGHLLVGERLILVMGDVTGHGVPSALVTAATRGALSTLGWLFESNPAYSEFDSASLLKVFNRTVFEAAQGKFQMTFVIALFDPKEEALYLSSAGHPKPYLLNSAEGTVIPTALPGEVLGDVRDVEGTWEIERQPWTKNHQLFLYTDGLIDAFPRAKPPTPGEPAEEPKNLFERKHLVRGLKKFANLRDSELIAQVLKERATLAPGVPQVDDISILVCSYATEVTSS